MILCYGCDLPVWEAHRTIEEQIACVSEQQTRVRRELDEASKGTLTRLQIVRRKNKAERSRRAL